MATRTTSGRSARLAYRPAFHRRMNVSPDSPSSARARRSSKAKPSLRLNVRIFGRPFLEAM